MRIAAHLGFQTFCDLFLGLRDGHTVEEARIDHAAVTVLTSLAKALGTLTSYNRAHVVRYLMGIAFPFHQAFSDNLSSTIRP
jgi:hypothetical protein